MSVIWLLLTGVFVFIFGWVLYSKLVAYRIFKLKDTFLTPAHEFRDNVDFVPTHKLVLWGHHFTAVAGAAPIVGPAIAVQWGWLPAFLWVVLGTIFFAGIHDMGALWVSVRNQGKSIGTVCTRFVGKTAGQLFMIVIFLVLLMVNSAFGVIIAKESVAHPSTIVPAWGAIFIALLMGQALYKLKIKLIWVTLVAVTLLYTLVPVGVSFPVHLPEHFLGLDNIRQWIIILFIYAGAASILPVWMLLQPRDYVNGIQLFIGLLLLYISLIIVNPDVVAPALIPAIVTEGQWSLIFPMLFITVACGAISGFHGIVSSGTTSKQVAQYKDVRFVGYLGAMGEGSLSLATILACVGGMALVTPGLNAESWGHLFKGGVDNFVQGGAAVIARGIGLSAEVSATLLSLMVVLFAATTMDAGIRLQRYIIQEWGDMYRIAWFRKKGFATFAAVFICFVLAYDGVGGKGENNVSIWPLFGATNQLLASLTLMVIGVILIKSQRIKGSLVVLCPMAFILTMSFWGALLKLGDYYKAGKNLLLALDMVVLAVTLLVVLTALKEITTTLKNKADVGAA